MALATSTTPQLAPRDQNSATSDPFWQSTPRNSAGLASLMSAIQQVVPAPATTTAPPQRATRQAMLRRPQCTHISMIRVYGENPCPSCGRVPDVGWLYACQQDGLPRQQDPLPDVDAVPVTVPDDSDYFDTAARVAEFLEMSNSVVGGIRAGHYDIDQVDKLIRQREKVIRTINEQENKSNDSTAPSLLAPPTQNIIASVGSTPPLQNCRDSLPMSPAGTPANTPHESTATTPVKSEEQPAARPKPNCTFQVCHTCRPFFADRMYGSFEAVLRDEMPQPTLEEWQSLPVMDRNIVSKIGERPVPRAPTNTARSQPSMDIVTQTDVTDDISVDWSDSEYPSERLESSELYPCPGPGQCPVWSRHSGCAYDVGFDDGRRAMNHGFFNDLDAERLTPENSRSHLHHLIGSLASTPGGASSTASSLSLPTPTTSPLAPLLPIDDSFDIALQKELGKTGKAKSVSGEFDAYGGKVGLRGKESNSSLGSEVAVQDGVALTEEAVESGTPDIITSQ